MGDAPNLIISTPRSGDPSLDPRRQTSTHWYLAVLLATTYDDGLSWSEEGLMMYDNEAGAQYLY
jgi:hypothetical protein